MCGIIERPVPMKNTVCLWLACAGCLTVLPAAQAQFADSVISYDSGSGFASGYTDPNSALGQPSRVTPDPFGGPVDPFSPPWQSGQLVSIGTGGWLTLQFNTPILNTPSNPFGIDFIVYGNTGFIITNGNFSGGGITDGSLFSNNTGSTRVSVSADNVTYYVLNPLWAPVVDSLFPTDGSGDFHSPVNPALTGADFAGQGLAGIRALYNGSAGGTGFDIGWAQDTEGNSVFLPSISYVKVEVLSGVSEMDGIAVVPEPTTWALLAIGFAGLFLFRKQQRKA